MPRKALQAAAQLGDSDAAKELINMRENLAVTIIAALVSGAVAVTAIGLTGYICSSCDHQATVDAEHKKAALQIQKDLDLKREADAAALRLKYVEACRVNPEQAETLVPVK